MHKREVDFPPVWLAGFAFGVAILGKIAPVELPYRVEVAAVLVILALGLMMATAAQMIWAGTSLIPGRSPRRLLTRGVFRFSRNPIYLADTLILTALCLAWGAAIALPLVPLFMLLITQRFIADEEARLERVFGEEYLAYKAQTRRWI